MFSSCSPCSAFVLGVNIGCASFSDSRSPEGILIPWTVPWVLYSFHPEPAISPSLFVVDQWYILVQLLPQERQCIFLRALFFQKEFQHEAGLLVAYSIWSPLWNGLDRFLQGDWTRTSISESKFCLSRVFPRYQSLFQRYIVRTEETKEVHCWEWHRKLISWINHENEV